MPEKKKRRSSLRSEECLEAEDFPGISCCLLAVFFYLIGSSCSREADVLKGVPRINQLCELEKLLESGHEPLMVAVSGKVGSETPIKCEFGGLQGAFVEKRAVQKFLIRNEEGDWKPLSTLLFSNNEEVPWYLKSSRLCRIPFDPYTQQKETYKDDGTGRVNVVGALHASGFDFPAYNEVFEQSSRRRESERKIWATDHERGLKFLRVKRIEWVLIGTSLSVVGQVVTDSSGTFQIQKPKKGPFYVSPTSIDDLIVNHRDLARVLKYASIPLSVIGIILVAVNCENFLKEQRRSEFQTSLRSSNTPGKDNEGSEERAVNASNATNSCVICLEQEYNVAFVPCGHMCCCSTCSSNLRRCPLCR